MRALFRDDHRQRWELTIDDDARERVLDRCFFNVPTTITFNQHGGAANLNELYFSLIADPPKVREAIFAICAPQCQRRGISYDDFVRRLVGCYPTAEREFFRAITISSGIDFDLDGFYETIKETIHGR